MASLWSPFHRDPSCHRCWQLSGPDRQWLDKKRHPTCCKPWCPQSNLSKLSYVRIMIFNCKVIHTFVTFHRVTWQSCQLDSTLLELSRQFLHSSKFSSADRCVISRVAEQHGPRVTDPFMKVDFTVSGISIKVWHNVTKFQVRHFGRAKRLSYETSGSSRTTSRCVPDRTGRATQWRQQCTSRQQQQLN